MDKSLWNKILKYNKLVTESALIWKKMGKELSAKDDKYNYHISYYALGEAALLNVTDKNGNDKGGQYYTTIEDAKRAAETWR